jgi:hypothetical protein
MDERSLADWIAFARVDADRRGLPALKPLLGGLEAAARELRLADWNDDFRGTGSQRPQHPRRGTTSA